MKKHVFFTVSIVLITSIVFAQQPKKYSSAAIYEALQKLNFLGSALYIAAHPDDENTRLISYLSNHIKARTAYLSLTRGDGGQNLIGSELRELLGVLRTQELLAARRIDGGEQFFTRANDFGYSKHPDETFELWGKNEVLADVVWAIRKFKPDIIINRFNHRTSGSTHGHHTASALLSMEAFDLVNDKTAYPTQLTSVDIWQPKRLFFNTSWWFYGSEENFKKADKTNMMSVDVGTYYALKGLSNNEIAALSSSQHKCQGFGRISVRGSEEEYVELLKGELPKDKKNLFDGINTTWTRVKDGKPIGDILYEIEKNFNFTDPSVHIPKLLEAYQRIEKLDDKHWRKLKSEEIKKIIAACAGLYIEPTAEHASAIPGETITIQLEVINRSQTAMQLKTVVLNPAKEEVSILETLPNNSKKRYPLKTKIEPQQYYTAPYWLMEQGSIGMYKVNNPALIGNPETPRAITVTCNVVINEIIIPFEKEVVYKYAEPSEGEIYQPFEILPPATASITNKVTLFTDASSKEIPVTIKAGAPNISGSISLAYPNTWKVSPKSIDFSISEKGDEKTVLFTLTPPDDKESEGTITPLITVNNSVYDKELMAINYEHIPKQSVLLPSMAKVVRLNIQKAGENIGYIMGAGDEVPESLNQIGYRVVIIDPKEISATTLNKFDAVVLGIRAYNVVNELKFKQKYILEYANNGGTVIVQYNTAGRRDLIVDDLAPYPLEISGDRVTDENSQVQFLAKEHSVLNFPNTIQESDFEGWIQERGLYFPGTWGTEFTPIISINDKGESPKNGSLLVAPYGKGYYIYTGLSFFRELPSGVPGAYKLFANMLSLGKAQLKKNGNLKG